MILVQTDVETAGFYNGKIVMMDYDAVVAICNVQKWVLNMEFFAEGRLFDCNKKDLTHVYSLEGDMNLTDPTIPTRMI